jgi:hypothetical protein
LNGDPLGAGPPLGEAPIGEAPRYVRSSRKTARAALGASGRAARFALKAAFCAAFACVAFFGLLTLWGLVAAPFVRMRSASFVIVCALAVAAAATVAAYGLAARLWASRRKARLVRRSLQSGRRGYDR